MCMDASELGCHDTYPPQKLGNTHLICMTMESGDNRENFFSLTLDLILSLFQRERYITRHTHNQVLIRMFYAMRSQYTVQYTFGH